MMYMGESHKVVCVKHKTMYMSETTQDNEGYTDVNNNKTSV